MKHHHPRPRIAVSACLLGKNVRYDGGHSQDRYLTDELGPHVEWVPICPEIEAGLGKPRPAIHLSEALGEAGADRDADRLLTRDGTEVTPAVRAACARILDSIGAVDGFLLKRSSPSCGPFRQTVYRATEDGGRMPSRKDSGLFARGARELCAERGLELAIEDEGRLTDPDLRLFFATRVFAAARWRSLRDTLLDPEKPVSPRDVRRELERFHAAHKFLLLIHDEPTCRRLGRLIATSPALESEDVIERYGRWFTGALARRAPARRHLNALQHLAGYLRGEASPEDRASLAASIDDFAGGIVPLAVPLTLLDHLMVRHELSYPKSQIYRQPFPRELALSSRLFVKSSKRRAS